ncbi:MAG: TlpA disulfide reductase family protein, partial [Bacteroidota bacterium]
MAALVATAGCGVAAEPEESAARPSLDSLASDSTQSYALPASLELPSFALPTLSGDRLSDADLAGQAIVLHFWAPWSRPSVDDLPLLDSLSAGVEHEHVRVIGVLETDVDLNAARTVVDSLGIRYPSVIDESGALARALDRVVMLPTTFLIDREGRIVERRVGAFASWEALRVRLRYLAERAPTLPPTSTETPQAYALTLAHAQALVDDGAAVYDVRDLSERLSDDPLTPATPAPLATLAPEQLPSDPLRPVLFVGDTLGT